MSFKLDTPIDMHLHLREGKLLKDVLQWSAEQFAAGVIMPNLVPPVDNMDRLRKYRKEILENLKEKQFTPLMTLFLRHYSYRELEEAKGEIFSIKLYPKGITTNSEKGVSSIEEFYPVFEIMEELEIPLSVHGETNGFVLDREREFAPIYIQLAERFPKLKIIMEHISTKELAELVRDYPNLYATVTLHHLLFTLDDLAGGRLNPHFFCKPILKTPVDRAVLQRLVREGHPRVMFGSDSAPHILRDKLKGAAGVFSAPVALPLLAHFFDGDWKGLQRFISDNARRNFNLQIPEKEVEILEIPWEVPHIVGEVIPLLAGERLRFRVRGIG
ncbi:MAG: dihydroorotase [Campylobacterales bacterium]